VVFRNNTILIISPEAWGDSFLSKHHYAVHLARMDNDVFFLNPPSNRNRVIKSEPNLYIVEYKAVRGLNFLPWSIRNFFTLINIRRISQLIHGRKIDIVWSFDPFRFQNLKLFNAKYSIYHAVDVHSTGLENQVAESANIIFGVSELILNRICTKKQKVWINHGLADHFLEYQFNYKSPEKTIRVGYIGNIQNQFLDVEILKKIIEDNTSVEFHFIGPYRNSNLSSNMRNDEFVHFLEEKSNCHLKGPIKSNLLPEVMDQFHVFLMCYFGDDYRFELSNSHKILEYLSTGRVIVSSYIDQYNDKTELVEMVNSNADLPGKFQHVISNLNKYNSTQLRTRRRDYSFQNSYSKNLQKKQKQ